MKMTKRELIELNAVLVKLSELGNTKFKYMLLRNIEILKPSLAILAVMETEIKKEVTSFDTARNNLILELGTKRDDQSVSIDPTDTEVMIKFNDALELLVVEHKEELEAYNTKMKEYQELLSEDSEEELTFRFLSIEQFPEDGITIEQLAMLDKFKISKD
ncbi:MAG: hypothetical protein ACOH2V_00125 [Candidatus Saccharimonadaceae bacterium]